MRVLHVITGLGRGGAELALCRLIAAQQDPSDHVVVSIAAPEDCKEVLAELGVRVVQLQSSPFFGWFAMLFGLLREIQSFRPQVLQTWMYHADLLGGIAGVLSGVPVCWGLRSGDAASVTRKQTTRLVARICGLLSRWVPRRLISCSASAVSAHRRLGYKGQFVVIPNGVVPSHWSFGKQERGIARRELGLNSSDFVFVHVGRGHPVKNQVALALAFNNVHASMSAARLLLFGKSLGRGDSYLADLPFTASARKSVLGMGQRADLPRLLCSADVFVLTSNIEGFPNVVAEAMAAGLPCVVTNVGDAAEIVGSTGIVVPPGDVAAIAKAMLSMAEMSDVKRQSMGADARTRIASNFTVARMATEFQGVWADVASKGRYPCVE